MRLRVQGPLRRACWRGDCETLQRFFSNAPQLLAFRQQLFDHASHLAPAFGFLIERLQPRLGDGVIFRFATVFSLAPGAAGPTALFNPDKSWINGALVESQGVLRDLLQSAGDSIGMLRTHGGKGAEDHEVESALQDLDRYFLHLAFK